MVKIDQKRIKENSISCNCSMSVYGLIKGYNSLFNPRVPHVHLNPLFREIPELDATQGGTILGASRDYVDPEDHEELGKIYDRLKQSYTSGRAGGLKNREPLEAVENREPPKGGYSSNRSIWSSLRSASSCSWMYLRTDSSSLPTVET